MRWTPENDQILLKLLIEKQNITVDGTLIASSWPVPNGEERPTARAITERIVKIRQQGAKAMAGNGVNPAPVTATPRTKKARETNKKPTGIAKRTGKEPQSSRKRKASEILPTTEKDDDNKYSSPATPTKQEIKRMKIEEDDDCIAGNYPISPAITTPGNDAPYAYEEPDEEPEHLSSSTDRTWFVDRC